jgi:hypothetical protein
MLGLVRFRGLHAVCTPEFFRFNTPLGCSTGPARCVAYDPRPKCPPGAVRGDVQDRRDRHRTGEAAIEHGLFNLMVHLRRSSGGW